MRERVRPKSPPSTARPSPHPQQTEVRVFNLSFAATPIAVRDALRAAVARFIRLMTEEEAGTLELILAEILNNIVEHGYGDSGKGTISLSIARDGKGLTCSVSDDGVALPPACLDLEDRDPERPDPTSLPEGGFGWFLIRDLATDLGYHREEGRNLLAFRMPLDPIEMRQAG
ncbi:serine/threonine-protein kinase RsbW [Thioclava sp. ES.031]|uniref:ATP-binding protein n=1 Tax=Thioclava sp. ES.031 TaxID=1798203 RepID=UPI000BF91873|nr:ATP-binding protein [Thioclava sp. ES.031]PFG64975.1 serine/threonine-protein kinase RsbW [Thioclava sp. ES.031]